MTVGYYAICYLLCGGVGGPAGLCRPGPGCGLLAGGLPLSPQPLQHPLRLVDLEGSVGHGAAAAQQLLPPVGLRPRPGDLPAGLGPGGQGQAGFPVTVLLQGTAQVIQNIIYFHEICGYESLKCFSN